MADARASGELYELIEHTERIAWDRQDGDFTALDDDVVIGHRSRLLGIRIQNLPLLGNEFVRDPVDRFLDDRVGRGRILECELDFIH
jgi:hypothetical protein